MSGFYSDTEYLPPWPGKVGPGQRRCLWEGLRVWGPGKPPSWSTLKEFCTVRNSARWPQRELVYFVFQLTLNTHPPPAARHWGRHNRFVFGGTCEIDSFQRISCGNSNFNTWPRRIWGGKLSRGRSCLGFPVRGVLLYQSLKMIKYKGPPKPTTRKNSGSSARHSTTAWRTKSDWRLPRQHRWGST